jgi:hypothetical protein
MTQEVHQEQNKLAKSQNVCGVPHLKIYDQYMKLLVEDNCNHRSGSQYFQDWIVKEIHKNPKFI